MTAIYTPARWSSFDGACRHVPWEEHFHGYEPHDGIIVPMAGDVGWSVDVRSGQSGGAGSRESTCAGHDDGATGRGGR